MSSNKRGFLAAFRNAGTGKRLGRSSKRVIVSPSTCIDPPLLHVNIVDEERIQETPEGLLPVQTPTVQGRVQTPLSHAALGDSAALRMKLDSLQKLATSNAKTIKVMSESLHQAQKSNPIRSACCQMPLLKKKLTNIVTQLYLGQFTFSSFYPKEENVIECIFGAFGVEKNDFMIREEFFKEWHHGDQNLQKLVNDKLRERRGSITNELRSKLFQLLGFPSPLPQANLLETQEWEKNLIEVHRDGKWRIGMSSDGVEDPLGSIAVHGAIARIMQGACYDPNSPVPVTLDQLGFFLHVMDYGLQFKTLRDGHRSTHSSRFRFWKKFVQDNLHCIRNFHIVEPIDLDDEIDDDSHDRLSPAQSF